MKKSILTISLVILLFCTSFISSTSSLKNEIVENSEIEQSTDCGCDNFIVADGNDNDLLNYGTMQENTCEIDLIETSSKPDIVYTPSNFNWADVNGIDWTTPAKNQGSCGSCWAFAAFSALESIIKIRENSPSLNPDLSEQYMLSCFTKAGNCNGGNAHIALRLINDTSEDGNYYNGVIPESCLVYQADDSIPCSSKCDDWVEKLVPINDYGYWYPDGSPEDIAAIKSQVFQSGPVMTHIFASNLFKIWGSTHHRPDDYYSYHWPVFTINHVVTIIGWKDDPNIANGGYWICKNSWGENWGYNGFFNIEYGCLNVDKMFIVHVDYDPETTYWMPDADSGGPYGALVNEKITFNASNSIGFENDIVSYIWDFGDDSYAEGPVVDHIYNNDTVIKDVTYALTQIENSPPDRPRVKGPTAVEVNKTYEYNFVTSDPEGNEIYYKINWGDETSTDWIGPYPSDETIYVNHTWLSNQPHINISVKSKDIFGDESDKSKYDIKITKDSKSKNLFRSYRFFDFIQRLKDLVRFLLNNHTNK